jgi:hypothetical protein
VDRLRPSPVGVRRRLVGVGRFGPLDMPSFGPFGMPDTASTGRLWGVSSVPSHVTSLRLVQPAQLQLANALPLLVERPADWLGSPAAGARPGYRRFLTDLSFPLREHAPSMTFSKAAYVEIGDARPAPDRCDIEIESAPRPWRRSSRSSQAT